MEKIWDYPLAAPGSEKFLCGNNMKYKTQREIVSFLLKYKMSFIPFDTGLEIRGHFGLEGQ